MRPAAVPHRRLRVCKAELHLQDVLRAQPQVATEQGHEDRVVPVILQGRRMLGGGSALPPLSHSQGTGPFPTCSSLPGNRGLSYCSTERPWLSSPLLQLLLDCRGKDGDSVGRHMRRGCREG